MYCKNCGKELFDSEKYCSNCGSITLVSEIQVPKMEKKDNSKAIIILAGVIIVVLVIVAFLFVNSNNKNNDTVVISQLQSTTQAGRQDAKDIVIHWYDVTGSSDDDWNVYTPYVEGDYLYIKTEAKLNSSYTVQYRGFGTASINDTFSKTVPIDFEHENSTVTKGEKQVLTLRIPVTDLDVQRPTTLYVNLSTYIGGKQDKIRLEFDISW